MKNRIKTSLAIVLMATAVLLFRQEKVVEATITILRDASTLTRGKLSDNRLNFGVAGNPVQNGVGVITSTMFAGSNDGILTGGSSNYIQNRSSLQSGTTFYVSSGTVGGRLTVSTLTFSWDGSQITSANNVLKSFTDTFSGQLTITTANAENGGPSAILTLDNTGNAPRHARIQFNGNGTTKGFVGFNDNTNSLEMADQGVTFGYRVGGAALTAFGASLSATNNIITTNTVAASSVSIFAVGGNASPPNPTSILDVVNGSITVRGTNAGISVQKGNSNFYGDLAFKTTYYFTAGSQFITGQATNTITVATSPVNGCPKFDHNTDTTGLNSAWYKFIVPENYVQGSTWSIRYLASMTTGYSDLNETYTVDFATAGNNGLPINNSGTATLSFNNGRTITISGVNSTLGGQRENRTVFPIQALSGIIGSGNSTLWVRVTRDGNDASDTSNIVSYLSGLTMVAVFQQ